MTTDLPDDPGEAVKTAVASMESIKADERALVSAMQLYSKTRSDHADYFEWPDRDVVELEIASSRYSLRAFRDSYGGSHRSNGAGCFSRATCP